MEYKEEISGLQEKIDKNNGKTYKKTCIKNALKNSRKAERIIATVGLSYVPYFGMNIAAGTMYKFGIINIPSILSAGIITVGSLVLGEILNRMITKKSRKYIATNKYTETMICEEIIKSEMEIEKLKNENVISKSVIDRLQESEQMKGALACLAKELDAKIQVTISEDSDKYAKKIKELEQELKSKYALLSEITKKDVLYKKYGDINDKTTLASNSIFAGILATYYVFVPMLFRMNELRTLPQSLIAILVPFTIGNVACASILNKRNKHLKAALNNLESQLPFDQKTDEKTIEELIKEISQMEFELREQKSMLEVVEENKKPVYKYTFDASKYKTEEYCYQDCEIKEKKGNQYTLKIPQKRL